MWFRLQFCWRTSKFMLRRMHGETVDCSSFPVRGNQQDPQRQIICQAGMPLAETIQRIKTINKRTRFPSNINIYTHIYIYICISETLHRASAGLQWRGFHRDWDFLGEWLHLYVWLVPSLSVHSRRALQRVRSSFHHHSPSKPAQHGCSLVASRS